ncbi:hypothetical protein ACFVXH_08620 [Kitasatospora sp. NPDC058184]|uniref:hypothetical protein n=1 Tax=Kitasatospora sp. NPDC058184 TaxID=3346370 RepID=UPI0036DB3E86
MTLAAVPDPSPADPAQRLADLLDATSLQARTHAWDTGLVLPVREVVEIKGRMAELTDLTGGADRMLAEAVRMLRQAGHKKQADLVERELLGRGAVPGIERRNGGFAEGGELVVGHRGKALGELERAYGPCLQVMRGMVARPRTSGAPDQARSGAPHAVRGPLAW